MLKPPVEIALIAAMLALLLIAATPSMRDASTTATVAQVRGELAQLRTAAFAYRVDNNQFPRMTWGAPAVNAYHQNFGAGPQADTLAGFAILGTLTSQITTPVAYLPKFDYPDPFYTGGAHPRLYTYQAAWAHDRLRALAAPNPTGNPHVNSSIENMVDRTDLGEFSVLSLGPLGDEVLYWGTAPPYPGNHGAFWEQYDPTNGMVSAGTIYLSEKHPEPVQRPFPWLSR